MISVAFLTPPEGGVLGFSMEGHAEYGEAGEDIVCAAVSSAAYLVVNTLTDVRHVPPLSLRVDEGQMFFRMSRKTSPFAGTCWQGSSSTSPPWRNSTPGA